MNEMLTIEIPQMDDDIDIFEEIKALLIARKFVYIDMKPEFNRETISYRFQRVKDAQA